MGAERTGYFDGAYARSSEELYAAIRAGGLRRGHRPVLVADGGRVRDVRRPARDRRRIARARGRVRHGWAGALPGRPHRLSRDRRRRPRGGHHGSDLAGRGARARRPRHVRPGGRALRGCPSTTRRSTRSSASTRGTTSTFARPCSASGSACCAPARGSSSRTRSSSPGCSGVTRSWRAATRWASSSSRRPASTSSSSATPASSTSRSRTRRPTCGRCRGVGARPASGTVPSSTRSKAHDANAAFQRFLEVVETLARERRLSRIAIVATRP